MQAPAEEATVPKKAKPREEARDGGSPHNETAGTLDPAIVLTPLWTSQGLGRD